MAYFGTNMVLAQAHWDSSNAGNNNFDLKQSSGFSSVTKVTNCHYRCNFSSTLADDFYVVCGSQSAENAATIEINPITIATKVSVKVNPDVLCVI